VYVPLGVLYDTPAYRCPAEETGWRGRCDTSPSCAQSLAPARCPFSHPGDEGNRAIAQAIARDAFFLTA
jgi:hypothetical protein